MASLNTSILNSIPIVTPSLGIQEKIVEYLETWDQYLEKLDQKIEAKKQIKNGLMQQLLVSVPEWKTLTVGDAFTFIPTGSHSKDLMSYDINNSQKPFNIHYGDIHTKISRICGSRIGSNNTLLVSRRHKDHMLLEDGDLVMADASEDYDGVGACVEIKGLKGKNASRDYTRLH